MAKLLGGPFSRASGQNSGLVFSSARGLRKKNQIIREYVIPANPRTNSQVEQRSAMNWASNIVQEIGRSVYQFDWNRSVRQLAGYPSLVNLFILAIDRSDGTLSPPRDISLGVRHFPVTVSREVGTGDVVITWSTEAGDVSSPDDEAVAILVATSPDMGAFTREVQVMTGSDRSDGATGYTFTTDLDTPGFVQIGLYFRNSSTGIPSRDRRSDARWGTTVTP